MKALRVVFSSGLLLMMSSIAGLAQSMQTDYDHSFNLARLKTYEFYQQERKPGDPLAASRSVIDYPSEELTLITENFDYERVTR